MAVARENLIIGFEEFRVEVDLVSAGVFPAGVFDADYKGEQVFAVVAGAIDFFEKGNDPLLDDFGVDDR